MVYGLDKNVYALELRESTLNFLYKFYEEDNLKEEYVSVPTEYEDKLYSVGMFKEAGVMFPEVHFIMHFKETSFCKGLDGSTPTLCTDDLEEIFGFNPYNGSGMKHPAYRNTYSVGSIGKVLKESGVKLPNKYKHYYNDPHAVYANPYHHCLDIAEWQRYWMERLDYYPKTEKQYIAFLKRVGYNPFDHYYNHPTKGLHALMKMYYSGEFGKKYNKYLEERLGYTI